jgi:hypothetical protein
VPDPMIVTPGQIVAPPDWETLYQQHGGIKSSTMIPLQDTRIQALIQADPSLLATLQQHPIYRYYMGDGSFVEAYGQENGQDVQIVDYKPSAKFQQEQARAERATTPTRTPEQTALDAANAKKAEQEVAAGAAQQAELDRNEQAGYGRVTDATHQNDLIQQETAKRAEAQLAITQGNSERAAKAQEEANQLARDRFAFEKDKANLPDVKVEDVVINGKHFTRSITAPKDGSPPTIKNFGPDGKEVSTLPDEVKPGDYQPLPAGVPEYKPNLSLGDGGIIARKRQLDQLVQNGTITKEQAAAEITLNAEALKASAAQLGSAVQVQENNRASQVTQRGQDLNEEQSRRQFSQGTYANVLSGVLPIATKLGGGANAGEIGARGLLAMLALGTANAQANGGLSATPPPQVQAGPLLTQQGQASLDANGQVVMPPGQGAASVLTPQSAAAASQAVQQQQTAQQASPEEAPWLAHTPLNSAPTTTIAPDGTVTVQHAPAFSPPPPVDPSFMQATDWNGGQGAASVLAPQAQQTAEAWHPNHDGTHDMLLAAGLDPDIVGQEAQRALGPSGSSMG